MKRIPFLKFPLLHFLWILPETRNTGYYYQQELAEQLEMLEAEDSEEQTDRNKG